MNRCKQLAVQALKTERAHRIFWSSDDLATFDNPAFDQALAIISHPRFQEAAVEILRRRMRERPILNFLLTDPNAVG